ncbi:MAG: hypothetical protein AAF514_17735 [Verrucomicrobiota bacterium]
MKILILTFLFLPLLATAQKPTTYLKRVKVKGPAEENLLSIKVYESKLKLEFESKASPVETTSGNTKRKYRSSQGKTIAEIKSSKDGFKVRNENGQLLWKVKLYPSKIRISENENGEKPIELKWKDGTKIKIYDEDKLTAEAKFYPDRKEAKVKNPSGTTLMEADMEALNTMIACLAAGRIPKEQRFIIAAELLARDQVAK